MKLENCTTQIKIGSVILKVCVEQLFVYLSYVMLKEKFVPNLFKLYVLNCLAFGYIY